MVIKLKMVCDEVEGFVREYLISDEATFLDLNKLILESCGYPDDQMTSFYILNDEWERGEQITREDMGSASEDDIYVMENIKLQEFIDDKGQKLEFVFDPFSERSFFLSVKDVLTGVKQEKPEIKRIKGDAPIHIAELNYSAPANTKITPIEDFEDDFYGAEQFDDDDLSPEAYEISQTPY